MTLSGYERELNAYFIVLPHCSIISQQGMTLRNENSQENMLIDSKMEKSNLKSQIINRNQSVYAKFISKIEFNFIQK